MPHANSTRCAVVDFSPCPPRHLASARFDCSSGGRRDGGSRGAPCAEERAGEDDGVERHVVLAHELHQLHVLRPPPPLLPRCGIVCGDGQVANRRVKPDVEHFVAEAVERHGRAPLQVACDAPLLEAVAQPRVCRRTTIGAPTALHAAQRYFALHGLVDKSTVLQTTPRRDLSDRPPRHFARTANRAVQAAQRDSASQSEARTRALVLRTYSSSWPASCGRSMKMCVVSRRTGFVPLTLQRGSRSSVGLSSVPQLSHWSPRASV